MRLIDDFQADLELRGLAATRVYIGHTRQFIEFIQKPPGEVDKNDLRTYLASLKARNLKPSTIDKAYISLSAFYDFLVDEDLLDANPVLPFRKRYLRHYKGDNGSESRQLISVEDASRLVNSILSSRDRAIVTMLFKTGMRRNELSSLDVDDISLDRMELLLKPTAKKSNRLLFFDYETADVLGIWLKARDNIAKGPALFPSRLSDRLTGDGIEQMVQRYAANIGLHNSQSHKLQDHFSPHCCRHWFTTHLRRAGMPCEFIQELRGDVRREAIDIYDHIDKKELRESYLAHIPQLGI